MSAQALTTLTLFLALLGGLALGWFARKWSGKEASAYDRGCIATERRLADDVEGTERRIYRAAAMEAEAVGKALAPSSIVWKAIVRALMKRAHPMLVTPPLSVPHSQTVTSSPDLMGTLTTTPGAGITWKTGDGPE